jgi:hypothetical protein
VADISHFLGTDVTLLDSVFGADITTLNQILGLDVVLETILVEDLFTDTDTTLLSDHTPDTDTEGNGWGLNPFSTISGNQAKMASTRFSTSIIDSGVADVTVTCEIHSTNLIGICTNMLDHDDGWCGMVNGASGYIYELTAGTPTSRDSAATTVVAGDIFTMISNGDTITLESDSSTNPLDLSYNTSGRSNKTETHSGIVCGNAGTYYWDNFKVVD